MRRVALVVAVAGALALPAHAAVTVNEKIPLDLLVNVPCANGGLGEDVQLNGMLHELISFEINGNTASGKAHFQPQGVSGVGLTTGAKYRGTGVTQERFKEPVASDGSASTFSFVNNFRIIGQGPGNNLLFHDVVHVTVNANGDVTAEVELHKIDCN
jgi:hypothetical protein